MNKKELANQWESMLESNGDGNKVDFVKFPEGVTHIRVLDAIPETRWTHWVPSIKRSVTCVGKGCPICEIRKQQKANGEKQTYSMVKKYALNVINRTTGNVEILDQGKTFFEDLRDLVFDNGDLREYDIKVRRRGTGKNDTSYRCDALDKEDLSESDEKLTNDKVDLKEYFKPFENEELVKIINGASLDNIYNARKEKDSEEIELA